MTSKTTTGPKPHAAPRITIGVTCHNAAATIAAALDSAAAQDWPDKRIIVVDDASTDNATDLIRNFIADHPGLDCRLIAKPVNEGYPAALNTIVAAADDDFIAFFDDDDLSRPDRLRRQFERLASYDEGDALCYSNRLVVPETGAPHTGYAIGRQPVEPRGAAVADFILWSRGQRGFCWGGFGSCTMIARTATLRRLGGFDPDFRRCAEWDLAIRHAQAGGHFIAVDDCLVTQRKTQSSDKAGRIPLRYALQLRRKHRALLRREGAYWGALLVARSRHWGARGRPWRSRLLYALAALASPAILRERLNLS